MRHLRLAASGLLLIMPPLVGGCGRKAQVAPPTVTHPPPSSPSPTASQPSDRSGRPSAPIQTEEIQTPGVPATQRPAPSIRIGLTTSAREARISATAEFFLVEKAPEAPRHALRGEYQLRVEQEGQESHDVFRLQAASLSSAKAAEELRRKLAVKFSVPVFTRKNAASGTVQVRLGEFASREEAQNFGKSELSANGYPDFIVVREPAGAGGGETTLALRGPGNFFRVSSSGFLFLPSSKTQFLRLDGKSYRGVFDIALNKNGRVTVVNELGMEEYLSGVVPAEIPPSIYPEPAALAAQAVAARTYALKNMGRFSAEGFDLTDDVRTQVYGGVAIEKQPANEAVRSTQGLAIYYHGELINAMYSSTCGGRTEDFSNVFDGPPVPYLTSVSCTVESGAAAGTEVDLRGKNQLEDALFADDGSIANRYLELAVVLEVVAGIRLSPGYVGGQASEVEIKQWVSRACVLAGLPLNNDPASAKGGASRAGFIRFASESLFGPQEIEQRISSADSVYYLGNLRDGDLVPRDAAPAVAYLMQKGLWRPYPDNSARPLDPIRRSDALTLLIRCLESVKPDILRSGSFHAAAPATLEPGPASDRITLKWGSRTQQYSLADQVRLFRRGSGRSTAAESIRLIGNEKVNYHVGRDGQIDFLEVELNPTGASSDRFSPQAIWETTLTRRLISDKLRSLAPNIGEIKNLAPERLGNSGRAVQIRVIGTRGSVVLNGNRVRSALGLKDTLFTISRTKNPDGEIDSLTFNGRGWGHGVGLCQVGAFGMARAGRGFEDILKTYYRGVEIRKAY